MRREGRGGDPGTPAGGRRQRGPCLRPSPRRPAGPSAGARGPGGGGWTAAGEERGGLAVPGKRGVTREPGRREGGRRGGDRAGRGGARAPIVSAPGLNCPSLPGALGRSGEAHPGLWARGSARGPQLGSEVEGRGGAPFHFRQAVRGAGRWPWAGVGGPRAGRQGLIPAGRGRKSSADFLRAPLARPRPPPGA